MPCYTTLNLGTSQQPRAMLTKKGENDEAHDMTQGVKEERHHPGLTQHP